MLPTAPGHSLLLLQVKLKDYVRYCGDTGRRDDQPLYLFDFKFADKCVALAPGSEGGAYAVPPYFSDDLLLA